MKIKEWKISPDFIPHADFHKGYWLSTSEDNPWYYFFPTLRPYTIPTNPSFYYTLDIDLQKIVSLLHKNKIPTTPSCAGHFFSPEHYIEIYERLERNAEMITGRGVILENSETGTKYFYKNKKYRLPWSVDFFVEKSLSYQKTGVLGFVDPKQIVQGIIPSEFEIIQDGEVVLMLETSQNGKERKLKWNELYRVLNNYLLL